MNKWDLIEALAREEGLPIRKAEQVVNTFFQSIGDGLVRGVRAEIRGFGSFKLLDQDNGITKVKKNTTGRTKEPLFKTGKELKIRIDHQ